MATRKTRAEMKAATRERVLTAAERVALEQGLARLTLEAVADKAGVTKGAIYSNFSSKEELLFEVVARLTPGLNVDDPVFEAKDLAELLELTAQAVIDMVQRRPREIALALEFDMLAIRDRRVRQALARRRATDLAAGGDEPFEAWLAEHGVELPVPPEVFLDVLNAVAVGLAQRRLVFGPEALPDHLMTWALSRLAPSSD